MLVHLTFIFVILFISIAAYLKRSLSKTGSLAAFFLGFVLYSSGGVTFLAPLFAFFVSSSLLTRFRGKEKEKIEKTLYDKTGNRDHVQVFANGGVAAIIAIAYWLHPGEIAIVALFAAFSACNADTWASEIGVLSKKAPVSILTLKPMNRGISGGVTMMGTIASFGGALLLAVFYLGIRYGNLETGQLIRNSIWITLAGFLGTLLDSILGALLQPLYRNAETGALTEKKNEWGVKNVRIKGFEFFSNDMVNFISSGIAACLVFFV